MVMQNTQGKPPLPLSSLNHISRNCRDIIASVDFYKDVLGFIQIRRPKSPPFNFDGAWLFQYGVGLHLLKEESEEGLAFLQKKRCKDIDPRDDHISFQADNTGVVEQRLRDFGVNFKKQAVWEGNIRVQQIFFHDPDGHMIEICDCEAIPIVPLSEECLLCPPRFELRKTEETKDSMHIEAAAPTFEKKIRWGVHAESRIGLPTTASCGDLHSNDLFPVCA